MRRTILLLSAAAWPSLATAQKPRTAIPIAQAIRTLDTGDTVTVAGRATAGTGQLQSTVFDVAVEDSSGGIRVFSRTLEASVRVGDSVVATGVVRTYRGMVEIVGTQLDVVPVPRVTMTPTTIAVDGDLLPRFSGRLVRVRGRVAGFGESEGGQFLRLRDLNPEETGTLTIWVPSNHGEPIDLSRVRYEDSVSVAGVISSYRDNVDDPLVWQIIPRTRDDIDVPQGRGGVPVAWLYTALALSLAAAAWLYTGRYRAHAQVRALRETEARYHQLLALSPDAVIVHAGGEVRFANIAAARLLGLENEQALRGRSMHDFVPLELRETLLTSPAPENREHATRLRGQLRSQTGRLTDVELTVGPCLYLDQPAVVLLARDITQQLRYERDLQALALVDELTGLANRRGFAFFAEAEVARARREQHTSVVVFADIDGLKQINDAHGHAAGDQAIRLVAQAFKGILRESDIVARWGGDEFVALIGEGGEAVAGQMGARLAGAIAALRPAGLQFTVKASLGVSTLDPVLPLAEAMERADQALYHRKGERTGAGGVRRE
ncbi:MAG: diguanylate cyclase [Gemmatimonadaceae bacterium]|jgi:diguanylate cyclase (GGDEF)-like protein/PAS domain S-box-containing protein